MALSIDIDFQSVNCYGETLCGDSFLREDSKGRTTIVHSDGLGHGPRANILSEITCEIVMSEWKNLDSLPRLMEVLAYRLPICSVRGIGYSTFTLIDFDHSTSVATIVEYDNPPTIMCRGIQPYIAEWEMVDIDFKGQQKTLLVSEHKVKRGDTIVVCSDGVTQSGLGLEGTPRGWGSNALSHFVERVIVKRRDRGLAADELASRVVERAVENDRYYPKDDISCTALLFK